MIELQIPNPTKRATHPQRHPSHGSLGANEGTDPADNTIRAGHDLWIQTVPDLVGGIFFSTFQTKRGQHVTSLTSEQARALGNRLMMLAAQAEER